MKTSSNVNPDETKESKIMAVVTTDLGTDIENDSKKEEKPKENRLQIYIIVYFFATLATAIKTVGKVLKY